MDELKDYITFHGTECMSFNLVHFAKDKGASVAIIDYGEDLDSDDCVIVTLKDFFKMAHDDALEGFSEALANLLANQKPTVTNLELTLEELWELVD